MIESLSLTLSLSLSLDGREEQDDGNVTQKMQNLGARFPARKSQVSVCFSFPEDREGNIEGRAEDDHEGTREGEGDSG